MRQVRFPLSRLVCSRGDNGFIRRYLPRKFLNRPSRDKDLDIAVPATTVPPAPTPDQWDELALLKSSQRPITPSVDIIVPVFRGFAETANAIFAAVRTTLANESAVEIIVVDDRTPEPKLPPLLDRLAELKLVTLIRHNENRGFVVSVNEGMKLHPDRDVILLNADTEVYGDWVERLRAAALSDEFIATVTPLSNNATICSYPRLCSNYPGEFELPFAQIDRLTASVNAGKSVDLPTGVGFCLYIRRAALQECGLFDDEHFGLGYGEENDFCLKAAALGYRNILAGDVFVRHLGSVSFLDSAEARVARALQIIDARYPHYRSEVDRFVRHDSPRQIRRRLDVARLRHGRSKSVMMVFHDLGGGTERHVLDLAHRLHLEGAAVYLLQPKRGFRIFGRDQNIFPNLGKIDPIEHPAEALDRIKELKIDHVHVHQLFGYGLEAATLFTELAINGNFSLDVTIHDYTPVCPRVTMIDKSGIFCGRGNVIEECEACVLDGGSQYGKVAVWLWRQKYERLLREARCVFVPNVDVKKRLEQIFPAVETIVRPHPEVASRRFADPIPRRAGAMLRVAVIGAIGSHKGSKILWQCAQDARRRRLPIQFVLVGISDNSRQLKRANVTLTGAYREDDLQAILAEQRCHLAFFPAVGPETYSYTLSEALIAGLYPIAFDIGAPANRIRAANWGQVLPFEWISTPSRVNDALLSCSVPERPDPQQLLPGQSLYANILHDYYGFVEAGLGEPSAEPVQAY